MNLEAITLLAGNILTAAVVGMLLYRRAWRTLPFFCIYSTWTLVGTIAAYPVQIYYPKAYFSVYLCETIVDSALQFCVLVEVAWSVFRPFRASLPRSTVFVLGSVLALAGAAIWPFADSAAFAHFPLQWHVLARLQQTGSILRVLFFLVLAGCSQILSIGWKDRELQVATGFGFYSFVSLSVTVLRAHENAAQYRTLDQILVVSYLFSLAYWIFSFAQKEAERREFSPQMQSVLLAMAGAARSTRIAMTDSVSRHGRKD